MSFVNIDEFLTSHLKFSLVKWRESCSLYLLKKILIKMAVALLFVSGKVKRSCVGAWDSGDQSLSQNTAQPRPCRLGGWAEQSDSAAAPRPSGWTGPGTVPTLSLVRSGTSPGEQAEILLIYWERFLNYARMKLIGWELMRQAFWFVHVSLHLLLPASPLQGRPAFYSVTSTICLAAFKAVWRVFRF